MSAFGPCKKRYIDKYTYLSSNVLGQGYSGTVYLGKNQQSGKLCAIKIIEKSILKYQAHKSMILCEIEFLTILKECQKILALYEVYNTKNNIYLVLELCNTDLKEYIRAKKIISQLQAIDIIKNIIVGYKSIWKANIVHRDLKPSNILLQDEKIKIADFGFSMFEKDQKQFLKINVGSPYYMPLEVLGYNSYSYQSDIWALGIIFFQMLTGKIPWKSGSEKQLFQQIKNFDILKLMPLNISQKSKEFLERVLTIDPKKRMKPQEITEFKFEDVNVNVNEDLRSSTRSFEAKQLQKSIRMTKKIYDPQQISRIKNKSLQEEYQNFQINIAVTNEDKNDLAHSRMRKQNNQQHFDQVNQLPQSPKKRKTNVNRKTSLQTQCQIFEIEKLNENPNEKKVDTKTSINSSPQPGNKKSEFINIPSLKSSPQIMKKQSYQQKIQIKETLKQIQNKQFNLKGEEVQNKKIQQIMKNFSKVLRSQIHFCRYLFKLLIKVMEKIPNQLNLVKPQLKQQMAAFIFFKLRKIQNQTIPDLTIYKEWLQTKQWDKIKTVIQQYKTKYVMSLQDIKIPKEFDNQMFKKLLRKAILHLYKRAYDAYVAEEERQEKQSRTKLKRARSQKQTLIEEDQSEIMKIKQQILILDYFITLKQLHKLEQKYGWYVFEEKSKIEVIVEGQALKYIQQKHILAISSKLQKLRIL